MLTRYVLEAARAWLLIVSCIQNIFTFIHSWGIFKSSSDHKFSNIANICSHVSNQNRKVSKPMSSDATTTQNWHGKRVTLHAPGTNFHWISEKCFVSFSQSTENTSGLRTDITFQMILTVNSTLQVTWYHTEKWNKSKNLLYEFLKHKINIPSTSVWITKCITLLFRTRLTLVIWSFDLFLPFKNLFGVCVCFNLAFICFDGSFVRAPKNWKPFNH